MNILAICPQKVPDYIVDDFEELRYFFIVTLFRPCHPFISFREPWEI
jgi:hypothetical protein